MKICAIEFCSFPPKSRGWCNRHYERWRRTGDPNKVIQLKDQGPAKDRFFRKVFMVESGCWKWMGSFSFDGYGHFRDDKKRMMGAHRWAYQSFKGQLVKGLTLDHLCRNRWCVNPEHLEQVTMKENCHRGFGPSANNARKTHCNFGHPYTGDNLKPLILHGEIVGRRCFACAKRRGKEQWEKRKHANY